MRKLVWILAIVAMLSIGFNVFTVDYIANLRKEESKHPKTLIFERANSRDTIFSMHNVKKAHEITRGQGIKVGVIDWLFGYDKHPELYYGGSDFSQNTDSFRKLEGHGYWMALTLREVAPEVQIYALSVDFNTEEDKVNSMIRAIDWAIDNKLDVLTYSSTKFTVENEHRINEVVQRALENNIVTTFIHYYSGENILPDGLFGYKGSEDYNRREPDLNIFHYDYSVLILPQYYEFQSLDSKNAIRNTFLSISSASPVTAGFVALLKSIDNELKSSEYKKILRDTSKQVHYEGEVCPRVVDIYEAVQSITNRM